MESVPDCYKNKKISIKAVDNYVRALELFPDCHKTKKCIIKL